MHTICCRWGNEGIDPWEFYCALGCVAEVPAFAERPELEPAQLAWAGALGQVPEPVGDVAAAEAGPSQQPGKKAAAKKGKKAKS